MIRCSLCSSKMIYQVNTSIRNIVERTMKIYGCEKCGVQFLYPLFTDEELKHYYNGYYRKEYTDQNYYASANIESFYKKSLPEAKLRVDRIKPYLRSQDDILEIGCSSGYFLSEVAANVRLACGTEWDAGNKAYAQELGFDVRYNAAEFDRRFDHIFMFHVLEHIRNPVSFLKELRKSLKSGGTLHIEVPNNEDALITLYNLPEFKDFYYQSAHLWYFNNHSLLYVLEESGFSAVVIPIQRYDLSNHLSWLQDRVPGGQGKYAHIISDACNKEYEISLKNAGMTDTIFAIARLRQ